jgi:uncharacterized membrane protein
MRGRILIGASAVLFGVVLLIWHDHEAWEDLPILSMPFGTFIGDGLAVAQIVGGLGMLYRGTARQASIVLGIVYVLLTLAGLPAIIATPISYAPYVGFFEFLSLVCGPIAVYAATEPNTARAATLGRVARLLLGVCVVSFTLAQIFYPRITADLVPTWVPPNQMTWVVVTTIAFGLAAVAMLINLRARLALRLLTLMLALFGLFVWVPMLLAHPGTHFNWSEFALNFLITGSAWSVAELRSF